MRMHYLDPWKQKNWQIYFYFYTALLYSSFFTVARYTADQMDVMFTQSYMACYFCHCEGSLVLVKAMEGTIPWAACQPIVCITQECFTLRMHFEVSHSYRWVAWFPTIYILYSWYAWKRRWHIAHDISFTTYKKCSYWSWSVPDISPFDAGGHNQSWGWIWTWVGKQ